MITIFDIVLEDNYAAGFVSRVILILLKIHRYVNFAGKNDGWCAENAFFGYGSH